MHLHHFPARVETPETTWLNYRVLVEPAAPGPWMATMYTKDAQLRRSLDRVSRVLPLGNRQWLIIGQEESWRVSVVGGCGCSSSQSATDPDIVGWLNGITEAEPWEEVPTP